jgi:hypothetical protein
MPDSEPPAQTHVNGTRKIAINERVVAPTENPPGNGSNQAPDGGEVMSGPPDVGPLTISENWKVRPQARQTARSVETLMSSIGIVNLHDGHVVFMKRQLCHNLQCELPWKFRY